MVEAASVPIVCNGEPPEWMLIDIQGEIDLITSPAASSQPISLTSAVSVDGLKPFHGKKLGTLSVNGNAYSLRIGHQICEGSLVKLPRPLLVTSKGRSNGKAILRVDAVIRQKISFSTRPKPVVIHNATVTQHTSKHGLHAPIKVIASAPVSMDLT